jgi:hypothetical protein
MDNMINWEDIQELELDPLAALTMTYTADGFTELKNSIKQHRQFLPITLRNGKILDGRHRTQACAELGIGVKYEETGDITDEEALDLVITRSINKAVGSDASRVEAFLLCQAKGVKLKDMPAYFKRLNKNYVEKMSYINKENPEYLQAILRQNEVRLYNRTFDKIENYGTLHGIYKTLKGNAQHKNRVIEVTPDSDDTTTHEVLIEDEMVSKEAVTEYWDLYYLFNIQHPSSPAGLKLKDLVNKLHRGNYEQQL